MLKKMAYYFIALALLFTTTVSFADELALVPIESYADAESIAELPGVMVIRLLGDRAILLIADDSSGKNEISDLQILDRRAEEFDYWMVFVISEEARQKLYSYGRVVYEREAERGCHVILALPHDFDYSRINTQGILGINPLRKESVVIPEETEGSCIRLPDADPDIQEMVDQISQDSFLAYDQILEDYVTRNTFTDENVEAVKWIKEQFESFGLSTELHSFLISSLTRYNAVAEQPGVVNPETIYIVIGHMDSTVGDPYTPEPVAPGADDNASGSATVLEVARVLSQYDFVNTIRYVCVSGEEQGLYGSYYYARDCYLNDDNIAGVINLDMIMYAPQPYDVLTAYYDSQSTDFTQDFEAYAELYSPELSVNPVFDPEMYYSDHAYFWDFGYAAFCGIEQRYWENPYYHTIYDLQENYLTYLPFPTLVAKGVCGALAAFAVPNGTTPIQVADFSAIGIEDGIKLSWTGAYEEDLVGYNIYRTPLESDNSLIGLNTYEPSDSVKVNSYPIAGHSPYTFLDDTAVCGVKYVYSLRPVYLSVEGDILAQTEGSFYGAVTFSLEKIFPNPAGDVVNISFIIPQGHDGEEVSLVLYDLSGRLVANIYTAPALSGEYCLVWRAVDDDGVAFPSGLYLLQLCLGSISESGRLILCH